MPNDLADALIRERVAARRRLTDKARRVLRIERWLSRRPTAIAKLLDAEAEMELAARDLVNLVDDSPARSQPKGWKLTPDARERAS